MRSALRPGGVMTMIVWRARADNPWLTLSKEVVLRYLPAVKEDAATCGPGPLMTDPDFVTRQLEIAGYADARFERIDAEVLVSRDLDEAVAFQLAIGPAGEVYREAGQEAERLHDRLVMALRDELRETRPTRRRDDEFEFLDGDRAKSRMIADGRSVTRATPIAASNSLEGKSLDREHVRFVRQIQI